MIPFQQVGLPHQVHDDTMGLPHVTVNWKILSGIQLDMKDVASGGVAQFKFLYAKSQMALVRHVLEKNHPVFHPNHAFVNRNVLRGDTVLLEGVVDGI